MNETRLRLFAFVPSPQTRLRVFTHYVIRLAGWLKRCNLSLSLLYFVQHITLLLMITKFHGHTCVALHYDDVNICWLYVRYLLY